MSQIKWDVRTTIPKLSCLRLNLFTENKRGSFSRLAFRLCTHVAVVRIQCFFSQIKIGIYLIRPFYGSKEYIHAYHNNDNDEDDGGGGDGDGDDREKMLQQIIILIEGTMCRTHKIDKHKQCIHVK